MIILLALQILSQEKPIIRLDEVTIEGNLRKPALIEIEGSKLNQHVEEVALSSLIRLEKELLKPKKPE